MAKVKRQPGPKMAPRAAEEGAVEAVATPPPATLTAVIEIPLGTVDEAEYLSRHVESRLRTREQQLTMKRLVRGLQQSGTTTKDGRPVQRPGEVIRWMLEQISESD